MTLDLDTMKYLEDVKRGKARRFVMIMKGEKIINLIVFKKGSLEKYRKEAKEEGAGQFYHGIVDGKGMNIVFKLSTVDGFTEPPGKNLKLKMYLTEESGIRFKPTYEIVTELPEISEVEDEADAVEGEEAKTEEVTTTDPAQTAKLLDALTKMTPLIKQALAVAPQRKLEILQPAATIKDLIAKGDLSQARKQLLELATLLKEITATGGFAPTEDLLAIWRTAKDLVDGDLEKFRSALAKTGDPYLTTIATGGIEKLILGPGQEFVTLQKDLFEVQEATGDAQKRAGQKLLSSVRSYKQYLAGHKFIEVCDSNELCGPLSVGKTLAEALNKLEASVGKMVA
jgi:hypothetical protein